MPALQTDDDVESLFRYEHLPEGLAKSLSADFHGLALLTFDQLPSSPERTLALRTLWKAKNLAVLAAIDACNEG